jgi:uncharacterized protein YegP (UPF0339 family)
MARLLPCGTAIDTPFPSTPPRPARVKTVMTASMNRLLASLLLALAAATTGACTDDTTDVSDDLGSLSSEAAAPAHFDVWEDGGQTYFHVVAGNGEVILTSEAYRSRTGALNGVLSVLENGPRVERYQLNAGRDGASYLTLRARNGQVIATGEGYTTAASARRAASTIAAAVARYVRGRAESRGARFDVFQGAGGRFHFNFHARNGAVVLRSQSYAREASALNGAFAVAEAGVRTGAYAVLPAASGGFYLNLLAANHEIVATSEVYSTKAGAERARDAIVALLSSIAPL